MTVHQGRIISELHFVTLSGELLPSNGLKWRLKPNIEWGARDASIEQDNLCS